MANKYIKGITIEIDGETKKLDSALRSVDKSARDIQSELKQVEKLLKLDPKNTELLAQKQKLLGDAVKGAKERLDALKKAQQSAEQAFRKGEIAEDQYRGLTREVIAAESSLKRLTIQQDAVNNKWKQMQTRISKFGNGATAAGNALAPVSVAIVGAGTAALAMSMSFDDAMAKVATIADTSAVPLEQLREAILDMSNKTGVAATDLADNVYNAISAGRQTADAVAFVGQAANLAKAGFADSAASIDLLTTIMNAYNLEASQTARVSDILIQTQNKGKTTVGELSNAMGKVIPTANAAGVQLEQLGAAYAVMTSNGIATAESTTYLNSMLNELSKAGSKSAGVLKRSTGKTFQQLSKEGKSIGEILGIIEREAKRSSVGLQDMFGSAEAGRAALVLAKDSGRAFADALRSMGDATGATSTALQKLQTPGEKARRSVNELKNEFMEFGDAISPILDMVSGIIRSVAGFFRGLTKEQKQAIAVVLGFVAALVPLLLTIGKISWAVTSVMGLWGKLSAAAAVAGTSVGAMILPFVGVAVAIAAVIAGGVLLWKNWDKIKNLASQLWTSIVETFTGIKNTIVGAFNSLMDIDLFEIGKNIIQGLINGVKSMIGNVGNTIKNVAKGAVNKLKDFLGIRSPSKVFEQLGAFTGEGFARGIAGTSKALGQAAAGMGSSAMGGVARTIYEHTGSIRIEGVNSQGQLIASQDWLISELRKGARRR